MLVWSRAAYVDPRAYVESSAVSLSVYSDSVWRGSTGWGVALLTAQRHFRRGTVYSDCWGRARATPRLSCRAVFVRLFLNFIISVFAGGRGARKFFSFFFLAKKKSLSASF
jgi:hypothetical protein